MLFTPGRLGRRFVDSLQPKNPISDRTHLPPIEIVVPTARKDLELIPAVRDFALRMVQNPVSYVAFVVPTRDLATAVSIAPSATIMDEAARLPGALVEAVNRHHPLGRNSWILQQVIKLHSVWTSESRGVLVVDGDTLLTRSRAFLADNQKQLLSFSHEFHRPYERHASQVWGARRRFLGFSFVTHHQLMQPWIVRRMFPHLRDLVSWITAASTAESSPVSEYHSYGRWLSDNYPSLVTLARWKNTGAPRSSFASLDPQNLREEIATRFPDNYSVSLHSYAT